MENKHQYKYDSANRAEWTLKCLDENQSPDQLKNKKTIIISDSQLQIRPQHQDEQVKHLPPNSLLLSYPGASLQDLLWLMSFGRVSVRIGSEHQIFSIHPESKNQIASEVEMLPAEHNFLNRAAENTSVFTEYKCCVCRKNCLKNTSLYIMLGTNNFARVNRGPNKKFGFYKIKLCPEKTIANLNKFFKNMGLTSHNFIPCPIIKQPDLTLHFEKIWKDIKSYNKKVTKINRSNGTSTITFSSHFRPDKLHLDNTSVISIFKKFH